MSQVINDTTEDTDELHADSNGEEEPRDARVEEPAPDGPGSGANADVIPSLNVMDMGLELILNQLLSSTHPPACQRPEERGRIMDNLKRRRDIAILRKCSKSFIAYIDISIIGVASR